MSFLRALLAALQLLLLRKPRMQPQAAGPGVYWLAVATSGAVWMLHSWFETPAPRAFDPDAFRGLALQAAWPLLLAYLAARALQRPGIVWPLATMLLVFTVAIEFAVYAPIATGVAALSPQLAGDDTALRLIESAWLLLATRRALDWLDPFRRWPVRSALALALTGALALAAWFVDSGRFFYPAQWDLPPDTEAAVAEVAPRFDPEQVLGEQSARLDAAIGGLVAGRPGVPDLWVVAFGGDGSEDVFRNEVLYAERLFGARFGAAGRTLVLLNHPDTANTRPLATRTNLRRALAEIGTRMARDEDILLLFLTTHGSEDHELYVALDPLPLAQLRPDDIAAAIRDAGIGWRVVLVSACYSGGFVPALAAPEALVIAAARADRTSFGCGADSEITWFGRALLVEALNRTTSFTGAFALARDRVARWERDEDKDASDPQIASAAPIEAQLARWEATLAPAPEVPFAIEDPDADTALAPTAHER